MYGQSYWWKPDEELPSEALMRWRLFNRDSLFVSSAPRAIHTALGEFSVPKKSGCEVSETSFMMQCTSCVNAGTAALR
jgi:hypothetical protein